MAPPGGSSSICLGGYGGAPDYSYGGGGGRKSFAQKSVPDVPARTVAPQYSADSREREVPGLEGHYHQRRSMGGDEEETGRRSESGYYGGGGGGGASSRRYVQDIILYPNSQFLPSPSVTSCIPHMHLLHPKIKHRGPLAGDDYAAQLRAQIAMKKRIDAESDDVHDRRSSLRRDDRGYDEGQSKGSYAHAAPEVANQQSQMVRRMADNRHDTAMQAYRTRTESDREKDYRRLQNASDGESNRQQGLTAKNIRAAAAERDRYPSENQRFNSANRGQSTHHTNGMAAALRGDDDCSNMQSSKRKSVGDPRRSTFSIGWE